MWAVLEHGRDNMNFIQEFYLAHSVAINALAGMLAVAILDAYIEKSKAKANSTITAILNVIRSAFTKKK